MARLPGRDCRVRARFWPAALARPTATPRSAASRCAGVHDEIEPAHLGPGAALLLGILRAELPEAPRGEHGTLGGRLRRRRGIERAGVERDRDCVQLACFRGTDRPARKAPDRLGVPIVRRAHADERDSSRTLGQGRAGDHHVADPAADVLGEGAGVRQD